jgi:ubiquinone/menaquinone biosynthesis C-methylase UbiE
MRALILLLVACGSSHEPDGTYAGRTIAPTMSYAGAAWLDRADREAREQPEKVLDALALKPTDVVADVGAGTGYFTLRLAKRVAHVFATDLQPEMRAELGVRANGVKNIEIRAATNTESGLPPGCCDLVLMVDVYHELADPEAVLATLRRAVRPNGRLVLVEYRGEDPAVPIKPEHKMTLAQLKQELASWQFVDSLEFLPDQRIVIFR